MSGTGGPGQPIRKYRRPAGSPPPGQTPPPGGTPPTGQTPPRGGTPPARRTPPPPRRTPPPGGTPPPRRTPPPTEPGHEARSGTSKEPRQGTRPAPKSATRKDPTRDTRPVPKPAPRKDPKPAPRKDPDRTPSHRAKAKPRPLRWYLIPLALVVLAWLVVCAITTLDAVHDLRAAVADTSEVRANLHTSDLEDGSGEVPLNAAVGRFGAADRLLGEPWMAPLRIVPYFGRQLHSAHALAGAAHRVTAAGAKALTRARALLHAPHATPPERAALLTSLKGVLGPLTTTINQVDLGPSNALLPTLASRRATFAADLGRLRNDLDRGNAAVNAVDDLIVGPRTYLVFAANNAEMRAGSGDYLEAGTLTSNQGTLTFGSFTATDELANPSSTVPVTGDMAALWGDLSPSKDYRELALSPQFPASAVLASQMWQAQTGQKVDGVLVVDIDGLRSILSATGPITSGTTTIDAGSVNQLLLEQQYVGQTGDDQSNNARHDQLGTLASAIFGAVQDSGTPLPRLANALAEAAQGRHLMAWSADTAIEGDWQASGAGGRVSQNGLLLSLINNNANKLDPYQAINAQVATTPEGRDTKVTVRASITNNAPPGLSAYAAMGNTPSLPYASYVGSATLDFPSGTHAQTVDRPAVVAQGPDYGSSVIGVPVQLAPGQTTTITWSFVIPGRHGQLQVDPSARVPPTRWQGPHGSVFTDATARNVTW